MSHKPMRASLVFAPGLSTCETGVRQPVSNQAAARTADIDFMWLLTIGRRRQTCSRSTDFIKPRATDAVWTLPHAAHPER